MLREGGGDTRGDQSESFADLSSSSSEAKAKEKDSSGPMKTHLSTSKGKAKDTEPTHQAKDTVEGRTHDTDKAT